MSAHAREPDFPLLSELRAVTAATAPAAAHDAIAAAARGLAELSTLPVWVAEIVPGPRGPVVLWRSDALRLADGRLEDWFARAARHPGRVLAFDADATGIAARDGDSWVVMIAGTAFLPPSLEKAMRETAGLAAQHLARLRRDEEDRRRHRRLDETGHVQTALLKAGADLLWQAGPDGVIRVTQIFHDRSDLAGRFDGRGLGDVLSGETSLRALTADGNTLRGLRVTLKGGSESYYITCSPEGALLHGTVSEADADRLAIDALTLETVLEGRGREEQLRRETETMMQGLRLLLGDAPFREKLEQLAQGLARVINCDDARLIVHRPGEKPRLVLPDGPVLEETLMLTRILAAGEDRAVSVLASDSDAARFLRAALAMRKGDIALIALPATLERHYLVARAKGSLSSGDLGVAERISLLLRQALLLQTDQNRMVHAAKMSALGQMSTSIAHELRQPLNTISIAAQNLELLAEMENTDPAMLKEKSARILGQVERACKVMDRMRRFGRKTAGEYVPTSLAAIARSARALMDTLSVEGGITVDIEVDDALRVFADELEIEQVLVNLIQNSADAIHEKSRTGRIRIWAGDDRDRADMVRLHVEDSGPGFPPSVLKHALDAFFTTKPEGKGTGLGLSIAHAILREHGGRLLAGNSESGGGWISLVLRRAPAEATLIPFPRGPE
jgi:signal transduction histidine kinase